MGTGGLSQKVINLTERAAKLENDKNMLERDKNELNREKGSLNIKIEEYKKENSSLKISNEEKDKEIEVLRNEIERLKKIEEKKVQIEQEKEKLKEEYDKEIEEKNKIKIEKENLQKENENLKYTQKISEEAISFYNKITNREIETKIQNKLKELFNNILNDENYKKDKILLENTNFKNKIEEYKENALKESIKEFLKDTKHINVILLGKTGVGKSSLINALLHINEAETGGFKPVTNETKSYEDNHLRLWDTVGIELNRERNAQKILKDVKKLILESEKKDPDWFIHCIWYCISGKRFESQEEGKIIDELMNTYKDGKIPIIIAYLQAFDKEGTSIMQKGIQDLFPDLDFMPIISKPINSQEGMQIRPMGLKEIKEKTITKFGESINSMSFVHIQNKVKQKVESIIDGITVKKDLKFLSNSICNLYSAIIGVLKENEKNEIIEEVKNINVLIKEKLNFNDDVMNYINMFKDEIKKNENNNNMNETSNSSFQRRRIILKKIEKPEMKTISEKLKEKIEELFNNGINEHNRNYKEEIYNFFIKKIKANAEIHIEESLKNIKNELKQNLQKEIQKSPNFQELLNKQ